MVLFSKFLVGHRGSQLLLDSNNYTAMVGRRLKILPFPLTGDVHYTTASNAIMNQCNTIVDNL